MCNIENKTTLFQYKINNFLVHFFLTILLLTFIHGCGDDEDLFNDDNHTMISGENSKNLTLGNPENTEIEYGTLSFGAEPPRVGKTTGLNFSIRCVESNNKSFNVYGLRKNKDKLPQVWRAETNDGVNYYNSKLLFEIPASDPPVVWNGGDIALVENKLYLLHYHLGTPAAEGHPCYVFSGKTDGSNWTQLSSEPVYYGQDALTMVWNKHQEKFVNYQTSFQLFPKKYPDNMPQVRRVLHIRTSSDCINWIPGESFAVAGPYLPNNQLIVPDSLDSPDTEFYHFSPTDLGEFWAGIMVNYISQPEDIPTNGASHGPFLNYEWWLSNDGLNWKRPFREKSALEGIPQAFTYYLGQPIEIEDELKWAEGDKVFVFNRKRMFYAYSRANVELITKELKLSGNPITIELSFDAINRDETDRLEQGYLMAELVDPEGEVIPGFEREKCLYTLDNSTQLKLVWGEKYLPNSDIYNNVHLRILSRDVRLYSIVY